VLGELVVAASDRIASKPTKPKRKKPVVAKDGTNRGRPANVTKGKEPFDKKAHDRAKSKERREAKKAESAKVQP
jgi:cytochrome c556